MAYLLGRSASGRSGSLPVRWLVTLAAHFSGPCPNLQADLRCGAYATRPLVCRIYPAEINPFRPTMPAHKACPEEAWATGQPPMARAGVIVDATLRADIAASRAADREEACVKAAACTRLGLTAAALIHEGFVVHRPAPEGLHAALSELSAALQMEPVKLQAEAHSLQLVSENAASLEWLAELGADTLAANDPALQAASYLGAVGAVSA
jgi:Fe-S-cluster containining protein